MLNLVSIRVYVHTCNTAVRRTIETRLLALFHLHVAQSALNDNPPTIRATIGDNPSRNKATTRFVASRFVASLPLTRWVPATNRSFSTHGTRISRL